MPLCTRPRIQRRKTSDVRWIESVIKRRFQRSDYLERSCEIWTSREPNAWESLVTRSRNPWLLLIHRDTRLQGNPHLAEVLHYTSFRVFTVDFDHDTSMSIGRDVGFKRLLVFDMLVFDMGDAVLLMDDVVMEAPEEALLIVAHVRSANESEHQFALRNRIIMRLHVHGRDSIPPIELKCRQADSMVALLPL